MSKTVKVAISLPKAVFERAEAERAARGVSRSEFMRKALEEYLRIRQEREWDRQDAEAYRRMPLTAEEIAVADAGSRYAAEASPWEDE